MAAGIAAGDGEPPVFFAGPCVIESREHALEMGRRIAAIRDETGARIVYKSSYDKANRSSGGSFRGPGLDRGLEILAEVRERTGLPVISDVHDASQAERAGM
ncbi:MAG TPA: 3-deoxy-8-phosphooctulonate synthase, partial [Thermoanaerobaculia bacterium]|nr:3-deoxy-8-phosphooctulonate synthase [Thermoanaerobaculia bacterium]